MSKKILFMSSAKLTAFSIGLLLAVFCTIGMSFTPAEEGENVGNPNDSTYVTGPRRSHWNGGSCGESDSNNKDYARTSVVTMGHGTVSIKNTTTKGSLSSTTTKTSTNAPGNEAVITWDCNKSTGGHTNSFELTASPDDGYYFAGWSTSNTSNTVSSTENPWTISVTIPHGDKGTSQNKEWESSSNPYPTTYYAYFAPITYVDVTFAPVPEGCSYKITVGGSTQTITTSNVIKTHITEANLSNPVASSDYVFAGWYQIDGSGNVADITSESPTVKFSENVTLGARFVSKQAGQFKIGSTTYYGLKAATIAAQANDVIIPVAEETVVDGSDLLPIDNGKYTLPAGAKLLIPYESGNTWQTLPKVVTSAATLSPYKKLILMDGVDIVVNSGAQICIGGQAMAASGSASDGATGYTTGACGVLDMSRGGHLELNDGSTLYCWGFVKGQDMDQGNNTVGVGTITVNSGATVWEPFSVGDWRGGSATSSIVSTRFFPFQSYFMQNIEVPTTFWHGSSEWCYFTLNATGGPYDTKFAVIGSSNCLFKLTDAQSKVRTWYDPTTDLMCYELSGSAILDELKIKITGLPLIGTIDINSSQFDLPITSNMHLILADCTMDLTKPLIIQPGSVVEIKNHATVTLTNSIYLYDKDDWGPWVNGKYFKSRGNLTTHKNRGNGASNEFLDDAKFIIDGSFTIGSSGKLYSTAGGANIMGNDGGHFTYSSSLTGSVTSLRWYKSTETSGDGQTGTVAVNVANLCNEDESYTKAIASTTFYNVHGRWFKSGNQNENADHTYNFTYIASGAVSGTGGTDVSPNTHNAVYAPDKTGLTAGMKWCNVVQDGTCSNIYNATQALNETQASDIRYTYPTDSWLQLLRTETEGVYGGSDNSLYAVDGCAVNSLGSVDENCLYTINDVKKALVDGHFVALEKNTEDEAWHDVANPTNYYISFAGCTWHPATKYAGEEKTYIVEEGDYIWYNNDWLLVEREDPFFFDYNEQNVKRYYEYEDGAWVLASPRVRVVDAIETRDFYFINDALTVASGKKDTKIKILKDISGVKTTITYSAKNTTCNLNLNGHTISGAVPYTDKNNIGGLLVIDASGSTFTITDSTENKEGKIENILEQNQVTYAVRLVAGTLNVKHGTIHVENNGVYNNSNYASLGARAIHQAANTTLNISGGRIESFAGRNAYGILQDANATTTTTLTMTGGDIYVEAPAYAYGVSAKNVFNFSNGTITVRLNTSTVNSNTSDTNADRINHRYGYGIMMTGTANATASSNIFSTLNMTGGKVYSYNDNIKTTTQLHTYGIYFNGGSTNVAVGGSAAVDGTYSQKWSAKGTISNAEIYVENTGRTAYGVFVVGNYNSKDNKSHVVKISNTKITTYASYDAIGVYANASIGATSSSSTRNLAAMYHADIELNNCEVKAETTSSVNAYAVYGISTSNTIYSDQTEYDASSKTDIAQTRYTGEYATASKITINGGTYSAKSATYNSFAIYTSVRSITTYGTDTKVYANKTPGGHKKDSVTLVVNGGTFNATSGSYQAYGIHSGGKTTIEDATFNVVAGSYYAYGLYVPSGKLTATNVQVNDTAKGRVKSSDNNAYAYGVQAHCGIPSGNTAQTGFAYAGEVELNNCTINAIATTYQNARGIFVNATSKLHNWAQFKADSLSNKWSKDNYNQFSQVFPCTQQGKDSVLVGIAAKVTINGGTINVTAHTTTAYGAFVNRALKYSYTKPNTILDEYQGQLEINNATFVVKTETSTTAEGVRAYGPTTITGGSFTVQPSGATAYGLKVYAGKTTVNGNPTFNVKATTTAYGIMAGGGEQPADKTGALYNGEVEVNGGTFNVETTSDKPAYGVYVYGGSRPITSTAAGYYAGNYASAGKAVINNGEFIVKSKKTEAYGIYMSPAVSQSGATGYETATATPICEVNGGTFTAEGTTDIAYGAYVPNGVTLTVTDGTFKGKLTAVAADKYAVGAYIAAGGGLNATGGTFEAEAAKSGLTTAQMSYACGLYSPDGTATISASNATFKGELKSTYLSNGGATTWSGGAYGFYARTTTPLSLTNCTIIGNSAYQGGFGLRFANTPAEVRNCNITVTTTKAYNYGLFVDGADCDVKLYDCNFTCTSGTTYAYGIYAYNGATYAEDCEINAMVQRTGASSVGNSNLYGVLVATGKTATLKGCTITATGSGNYSNNGYGVYVDGTANLDNCDVAVSNINDGAYALFNTSNTTLLNVASGKYKASATTNAASTNGTAASAKQTLNGGYYSHNTNLSKYAVSPKKVLTLRESHTLYPDYKYTINEGGTVTWKNGTTTLKTEMYESGETPEYTGATPTKTETAEYTYTHNGWDPAIAAMANADQTYTATFNHIEKKYKVNVAAGANGSASPASVSEIGCETASGDITATPDAGYSFSGWTLPEGVTAATGYNASSNPIHIHATATGKSITASFAARNDISYTVKHWQQNIENDEYTEVTADQETKQGTTATSTAATAKSYTGFTAQPISQGTIAGDGTTVVSVYYNRNTFAVTWNWNESGTPTTYTDNNVRYGATAAYTYAPPTKPSDATYNYTFTGWSDGTNTYAVDAALPAVTAATTYTATFSQTENKYTVAVAAGANGAVSPASVSEIGCETASADITATPDAGYAFNGWTLPGGVTAADGYTVASNPIRIHAIAADKTIMANFVARTDINYTVKHYQQNIADDDYTEVTADQETKQGTTATATEAVAKEYDGFTALSFEQGIIAGDGNTVVNIYYNRNPYTITFDSNGGSSVASITQNYGTAVTAPADPTREGYTFNGWSPAVPNTMPVNGLTCVAQWTINQCLLTVLANNDAYGTVTGSGTYDYGTNVTITATPETGYKFVQWNDENADATRNVTIPAGNVTYTATFAARDDINYTVKHWQQNVENDEYTEFESETKQGTTATATAAVAKLYTGFEAKDFEQGTIAANGSTEVNIYYDRLTYDITWKDGTETIKTEQWKYGSTPAYAYEKPETAQYTYTLKGWSPEIVSVTKAATYTAQYDAVVRKYTITFVNDDNETVLQSSDVQYGVQPSYTGETPISTKTDGFYQFAGWSEEMTLVTGPATYTAQYTKLMDIVVESGDTVDVAVNVAATTTTVHAGGMLHVAKNNTLTTDDLILEATPTTSGEIIGEGKVTATNNAYFHLSREGGFKARTWYAVAVPWEVLLPGEACGVYIKNGETIEKQYLGTTFDLIYYDGASRAQGKTKAWRYVEDDEEAQQFMDPGRAYMIYLTKDAEVIRFQKRTNANFHMLGVKVKKHDSDSEDYKSWNGIANPATYHAYLNVHATEGKGQVYNAEKKSYDLFDMRNQKLVVGQPVFVQVPDELFDLSGEATVAVSSSSYNPVRRRAKEQALTRYELMLAASDADVTDRVIVRMDENKTENEYVIGQDLVKMGVSDIVPQMWINRYDSKMCVNTVAGFDDTADYPLSIFAPKKGEYDLFIDDQPDNETMLYLTYDGEAIWNLSYGGYVASLDKGTNTHYGLRIVKKAPQITTGIEETTVQNGEAVRKVLVNDKVYIIRNGEIYSVTGQKAK